MNTFVRLNFALICVYLLCITTVLTVSNKVQTFSEECSQNLTVSLQDKYNKAELVRRLKQTVKCLKILSELKSRQDDDDDDFELPTYVPEIIKVVGSFIAGNASSIANNALSLIDSIPGSGQTGLGSQITGLLDTLTNTIAQARPMRPLFPTKPPRHRPTRGPTRKPPMRNRTRRSTTRSPLLNQVTNLNSTTNASPLSSFPPTAVTNTKTPEVANAETPGVTKAPAGSPIIFVLPNAPNGISASELAKNPALFNQVLNHSISSLLPVMNYPNQQPPQNYPNQPVQNYPYPPIQSYPNQQPIQSYPQPVPGYPNQQPIQSYPNQQPVPGYPNQQPVPGYPNQQPVPGYPNQQPVQNYPYPPVPNYPNQPVQNYPNNQQQTNPNLVQQQQPINQDINVSNPLNQIPAQSNLNNGQISSPPSNGASTNGNLTFVPPQQPALTQEQLLNNLLNILSKLSQQQTAAQAQPPIPAQSLAQSPAPVQATTATNLTISSTTEDEYYYYEDEETTTVAGNGTANVVKATTTSGDEDDDDGTAAAAAAAAAAAVIIKAGEANGNKTKEVIKEDAATKEVVSTPDPIQFVGVPAPTTVKTEAIRVATTGLTPAEKEKDPEDYDEDDDSPTTPQVVTSAPVIKGVQNQNFKVTTKLPVIENDEEEFEAQAYSTVRSKVKVNVPPVTTRVQVQAQPAYATPAPASSSSYTTTEDNEDDYYDNDNEKTTTQRKYAIYSKTTTKTITETDEDDTENFVKVKARFK